MSNFITRFAISLSALLLGACAESIDELWVECDVVESNTANAPCALELKSCYKNTENMHPKVLYMPDSLFGYCYWMAYSPYPMGNPEYENPCIAYSNDGYRWKNIDRNPIEETPDRKQKDKYNSDPHLVFNDDSGELECWFRVCDENAEQELIYRRVSTDGQHWSDKQLLHTSQSVADVLSPSVIYRNHTYCIWVNRGLNAIDYYESADGTDWRFQREISLLYQHEGDYYQPWHNDVIYTDGQYIMTVMCKSDSKNWVTFLTTSPDNEHYELPYLVLQGRKGAWDETMYRACLVQLADNSYRMYYSARNASNRYGIGITESTDLRNWHGIQIKKVQ
ncbi:MAG: hypothetical protein HUK02_09360 [Bacteroidaceae bacterium]|nr:hypothetical protein [Bacteroidaceae bacterium]